MQASDLQIFLGFLDEDFLCSVSSEVQNFFVASTHVRNRQMSRIAFGDTPYLGPITLHFNMLPLLDNFDISFFGRIANIATASSAVSCWHFEPAGLNLR